MLKSMQGYLANGHCQEKPNNEVTTLKLFLEFHQSEFFDVYLISFS